MEQQQEKGLVATTLTDLPAPLQVRRELYLQTAENDEQRQLITAYFNGRKLADILTDADFASYVVGVISTWRLYLGATKDMDPDGKKLLMECKYVGANHGNVTILEFEFAIKLYIERALPDIDYRNYTNFSPALITETLIAYRAYNEKKLSDIIKKINALPPDPKPITAKEWIAAMQWNIGEVYARVMTGSKILMHGPLISMVCDYLRSIGEITYTESIVEQAKAYAKHRMKARVANREISMNAMLEGPGKSDHIIYAKEFCLLEYFRDKTVDQVKALVTEEQYNKRQKRIK